MRTGLAGLGAIFALLGAGCGGDKPPPGVSDVDTILAAASNIVFQCRSVERGFLSTVDEEALGRDVDALVDAAEELDPDVTFRRPEPAIEPETTLRHQAELTIARLEDERCSPEDAERLRDAIGD